MRRPDWSWLDRMVMDLCRKDREGASRRDFLASMAVVGAGAAMLPASRLLGQVATSGPKAGRIDVHNHFSCPALVDAVGTKRLGGAVVGWSPEKAMADMDGAGVATGMTSIAPQGDPFGDAATAPKLARACNEYAAKLASDHPGRFGVFAMTPMPNIDGTLKEIAYAFDTLKADGIGMFTSYGDKWLGDAAFNPVFEELNRRKAVVYTHPQTANCCKNLLPSVGDGAIEWGTDTTRAVANMIFGGAQMRYPNVKMIFSHGGGTMPFLIERFANMAKSANLAPKFPQGFVGAAAKYFYDTAQVANPAAMSALSKVVPITSIVFGTDFPFRNSAEHVKGLKECGVFSEADLAKIDRTNVAPFLPRFNK